MVGELSILGTVPTFPGHAVLALGGNLGDRLATLQRAVDLLAAGGTSVTPLAVSPVYETAAIGPPQPDYLNAVLVVGTLLAPRALLAHCQRVENLLGRVRLERWGARTIDVDILMYSDLTSDEHDLTLPHPRAHERSFVLAPWRDVEPDATIPGHGKVTDLLSIAGIDGVYRRADLTLHLPHSS